MQQATWLKGRNSMCIFSVGQALVPTQEEKTICALVERIYLIIVSREGNHARFELLSKIFESFNVMGCIPPPVCLWACKERYNLCMNPASLDRESLDRVSWTSTTPPKNCIFIKMEGSFHPVCREHFYTGKSHIRINNSVF